MAITENEVNYIGQLARLQLAEDEVKLFTTQLSQILDHAKKISSLELNDIPPTAHILPVENVFRQDKVLPSLSQGEALKNAHKVEKGCFAIPKII